MDLKGLLTSVVLLSAVAIGAAGLSEGIIDFRNDKADEATLITETNETVTLINGSAVALSNTWVRNITLVSNCSTNLPGNNYSLGNANTEFGGTITLDPSEAEYNATFNVSYTWYNVSDDEVYQALDRGLAGTANITERFSNIGTFIAIAAMVGVVTLMFVYMRRTQ